MFVLNAENLDTCEDRYESSDGTASFELAAQAASTTVPTEHLRRLDNCLVGATLTVSDVLGSGQLQ